MNVNTKLMVALLVLVMVVAAVAVFAVMSNSALVAGLFDPITAGKCVYSTCTL